MTPLTELSNVQFSFKVHEDRVDKIILIINKDEILKNDDNICKYDATFGAVKCSIFV